MNTATQPYEIQAWLGDGWTDEQIQQITDEYLELERQFELDPASEDAQALLQAVAQRVDGTLDRNQLVRADTDAQIRARSARRELRAAVRAEVAAGMSESEAARLYGITRMTVRAWMGKD